MVISIMQMQCGIKTKFNKSDTYTSEKALSIISFEHRNANSNTLFSKHEITKLPESILIENCQLISKSIHSDHPSIFNNWFTLILFSESHYFLITVLRKD